MVAYQSDDVVFSDGERTTLRRPTVALRNLAYGEIGKNIRISSRNAPPVFGLGLLEAVPESEILSGKGKPNYVWDIKTSSRALDRFGLKANQPSLEQQIANAFAEDIGVPDIKLFLYAGYRPTPEITLTPNIEMASSRWTSITNGQWYYRTGAYFLTNFNADYQVTSNLKFSGGVRNLFDQLYTLTDGFPEPGRSMYFAVKATF